MTETKVLDLTKLTEYNTKLKNKIRWFGLKDDYDAIAVKDPNTLYFITDLHKIIRDGKTYGIGFDIHSVSAEPATTLGNKGDFAIEQDPANPDYGVWWYKYDTDKWENLTGARIDVYNQFAKGSSFGGSVTILTTDGADQAKVILEDDIGKDSYFTKYCVDSVKFSEDKTTWFSLNFPTLTANDTFATTSKTQPKIAFVKSTDPEPVGEDGDFYVKYTLSGTTVSDPKLYGKISGTWYLLGGGGGDTAHLYGDGDSSLPATQKNITSGDTLPATLKEGDIFLKHRGTGKDYLTTDDLDTIKTAVLDAFFPVGSYAFGVKPSIGTWTEVTGDRALWLKSGVADGTTIAETLPNVKGQFSIVTYDTGTQLVYEPSGALVVNSWSTATGTGLLFGGNARPMTHVKFDAAAGNPVYVDGGKVQPNAYVMKVWKRTA